MCVCVFLSGRDSPGNAEHHHTDDDHLERSDDRGDEDVVQFARAWHHVQHVVLLDVTLGAPETRVTAEITHTHTHTHTHTGEEKRGRESLEALRDRFIILCF